MTDELLHPAPRRRDPQRVDVDASATRLVTPDGTTLEMRPLASSDAPAVADLYRRLPAAEWARHLGVCDANDRGVVARAVSVPDRGGRGLVAVTPVASPGGAGTRHPGAGRGSEIGEVVGEVMGEAHYELLPDGHGDLTLVLAPAWRDWLGPRLFDAILDVAAAQGIANIEADVMRSDEWMLRLIDARGRAALPTDGWLSTRLVLGTQGCTPMWDVASDPRVLVEAPGAVWHAAGAALAAELAVLICAGPGDRGTHCPVTEGRPCPLAAGADVIVVSYPPDRWDWDELLVTHREMHPDVAVCVEGRAGRPVPEGVVALDVHDPTAVVRRIGELAAAHAATR